MFSSSEKRGVGGEFFDKPEETQTAGIENLKIRRDGVSKVEEIALREAFALLTKCGLR
jgi:hypothetical protein